MQKRLCTQKIPNHKKLDSWTVLETPHHLQDSAISFMLGVD